MRSCAICAPIAGITILHFFLDMLATFFLQQFFQQLATYLIGEPRPEAYYR
jgi:hypothetical protein